MFSSNEEKLEWYETLKYLFMSSWVTIVLWFLITVLIFYIKQSGVPYKSEQHSQNVKYIGILFLLWGGAFIVKAVLSYFSLQFAFDDDPNNSDDDIRQVIMVVVTHIVTDIVPCLSVLEVKFIELFKNSRPVKLKHTESEDDISA